MEKKLERILREEQKKLESNTQELQQLKGGRLIIRNKDGRTFFTEERNGKERGISRDIEKVEMLARKAYLLPEVTYLQKKCKMLKGLIDTLNGIRPNERDRFAVPELKNIVYPEAVRKWLMNAEENHYMTENLRYMTEAGIKVRSKSERTIADRITAYGLPYKYEKKIHLDDEIFIPDFTVMKQDGTMVIWEHFGLMNNRTYEEKTVRKILAYQRNGYYTHTNLICTWEKDIESTDTIDEIIERYLL